MRLQEYIDTYYNGNKQRFGKDNGKSRQHVRDMLRNGNFHVTYIEGELRMPLVKHRILIDKIKEAGDE